MNRAVAYLRYSSDNQREESITAQLRAVEEYCTRKGYAIVATYADEAKSATTDRHPEFQRMISDAKSGLFDVAIVHKLDRFARDRYDSAYYKRSLRQSGVRLESVLEQFDNSPESIILESVLEGMAEYYSKNLAREARKGMMENALKGIHAGGRPPYGYKLTSDKHLEIDPKTAPAVRYFFENYANGMSMNDIERHLYEMGFRSQTGVRLRKTSFYDWAVNRKYIGIYTWDVEQKRDKESRQSGQYKPLEEQVSIPNVMPALVDEGLFNKVKDMMQKRREKGAQMKAKQVYLLSGKIVCGKCAALYHGNSYKNTKSRDNHVLAYYRCKEKCGNIQVDKESIEQEVIQHLLTNVLSDEGIETLSSRTFSLYREQQQSAEQDEKPILREIESLKGKINKWLDLYADGVLDKEAVTDRVNQATQQKRTLEGELTQLRRLADIPTLSRDMISEDLRTKKNALLSGDGEDKKRVVQRYVDEITIYASDDPNDYEYKVRYRVFIDGGEGNRTALALIPLCPV